MADKKISELTTSAALTNDDIMAVVQMQSGALTSVKATLYAIAVHITKLAQYTSDLQTTDKTIIGAINELKRQIALIPGFNIVKVNSLPTENIDTHTLYLVPSQDPEAQNSCDEYINTDGTTAGWELVGSTNIDLSDYYTKLEVDGLLADKLEADDFEANHIASANPITLETKQAGLAKSCVVEMNPIQDLHGYDNPWAGGARKNKADINDLSLVQNDSGNKLLIKDFAFTAGTYTMSFDVSKTITSTRNRPMYVISGQNTYAPTDYNTQGRGSWTFTFSSDLTVTFYWWVVDNSIAVDITNFMIESGSTATSYEPYENICPISGRTESSVTRTGVNLFDFSNTDTTNGYVENKWLSSNGNEFNYGNWNIGVYTRIFPNTQYTISGMTDSAQVSDGRGGYCFYDDSKTYISGGKYNSINQVVLTPNNAKYIRVSFLSYSYSSEYPQLELGSTATAYEPYTAETKTHQYSETIYGGVDDFVNGGATSTMEIVDLGTLTWANPATNIFNVAITDMSIEVKNKITCSLYPLETTSFNWANVASYNDQSISTAGNNYIYVKDSRYNSASDFKTAMNGVQLVYELATPTKIQLSPEAVTLLKGLNVISTDGDKVQVEFSDIPVGDYSVLLDYIKSLEARIQTLEGGGNRTLALTKNILQEEKNDIIKEEPEELELEKGQEEEKEETMEEKTDEEPEHSAESK